MRALDPRELAVDLRQAARSLRRAPAFTLAAVLTLGLGMSGAISMFTLVQGVLLRSLPVPSEDRLVVGWRAAPEVGARHWPFERADLDILREQPGLFERVAGVGYNDPGRMAWVDRGQARYVRTARVTGEFFEVLGTPAMLGRTLGPADDVAGAENAAVITHAFWRGRFGGSRDAIGRRVSIGGQPFVVVGVMPGDIEHPRQVEVWMTVAAMQTTTSNPTFRGAMALELDLLARLDPDVTPANAAARLPSLADELDARRSPGEPRDLIPTVQPYREFLLGDIRQPMLVLFAAVVLVLVIAAANVANLLLVRGESRLPELAVRAAVGAGRARIVWQLLVESAVLTAAACGVGLVVAWWTLPVVVQLAPSGLPRTDAIRLDLGVVAFTFAVGLVTACVAGIVPAWLTTHGHLAHLVRSGGAGTVAAHARLGRRSLVVVQVALAVIGVAAAGLLVRSLQHLEDVGRQLSTDTLVHVPLALPQDRYADRKRLQQFITDLAARLREVPAIAGATPVNVDPFTGVGWDVPTFTAEGQSADEARSNATLNLEEIHPGYFDTFAVRLTSGRAFTDDDRADRPRVAIVSADVAARTWPGEEPLGKRLKMGGPASTGEWWTVVGVAEPTRYRDLRQARSTLYVPALQLNGAAENLVVRTTATVSMISDVVRAEVARLDPGVEVMPVRPFSELLDVPLARPRFNALLTAFFGLTGVALSVIGLYGAMVASVHQRRREIGVRMALGADGRSIRGLVLAEGGRLVAVGVTAGLALALVATSALRGMLFGVEPLDPATLLVAVAIPVAVSAVALHLPARRASRFDPTVMLRAE